VTLTLTSRKPSPNGTSTPILATTRPSFAQDTASLSEAQRRWLKATGFDGAPDTHVLLPAADGTLEGVVAGVRDAAHPWALASLPKALPSGRYRLHEAGLRLDDEAAALSWALGSYTFDLYKPARRAPAELLLPPTPGARRGALVAAAIEATRDLVNTPAEHMGPAELAEAARALAKAHGARFQVTVGDALLKKNFPAIHAVGRAAARAPRLIEFTWGSPKHPKLTLVGKGVCFDSGGLDIKPPDGMRWMKKDMGGAAHALGLAMLVMALKLPVRLQVLIPAVENAISGNAFRPGDVFKTRAGLHIEIGNTDAEGRVILCDALAYGAEAKPELMIDMATLTGAARVALGSQLPALFTRSMAQARELVDLGMELKDPMWHLPLWRDYHGGIESDIADIVNTGRSALAGAINAALFLEDFVPADQDWLHLDLFAWNDAARPGRPVGGEAQTVRTLLAYLERRFAARA
jgi:leucyl aminopeptidase